MISRLNSWQVVLLAVIAFTGAVWIINNLPDTPAQPSQKAANEKRFEFAESSVLGLNRAMRDPDSLRVASAIMPDDETLCYVYRARNGFGGMNESFAIQDGALLRSRESQGFDKKWEDLCVHRAGTQMAEELNYVLDQYRKRQAF